VQLLFRSLSYRIFCNLGIHSDYEHLFFRIKALFVSMVTGNEDIMIHARVPEISPVSPFCTILRHTGSISHSTKGDGIGVHVEYSRYETLSVLPCPSDKAGSPVPALATGNTPISPGQRSVSFILWVIAYSVNLER
jgi:hypothetical protein